MIIQCKECGNRAEELQNCTICDVPSHARMFIQFAHMKKRYLVCSNCWTDRLAPALRFLRKNGNKNFSVMGIDGDKKGQMGTFRGRLITPKTGQNVVQDVLELKVAVDG